MEEISVDRWGPVLENRKLIKLIWHVTNRCNFACSYCYVVVNRYKTDLPTEQMFDIVDQINRSGIRALNLTGGEVFTREDILPILERIHPEIRVGIATNGSRITPEIARAMAERDAFASITIDSLDDAVNQSTRVGSDTPRLLENVKLLIDSGVRTGLSVVATRTNAGHIAQMAEHFYRMGAVSWKVGALRNTGEALESHSFSSLALGYEEEERLLNTLYDLRLKYRPLGFEVRASFTPHPVYFEKFASEIGGKSPCLCGYARAVLKHDGGLVPCDAIKYPDDYVKAGFAIPNILQGSELQEAFYESSLFRLWTMATSGAVPVGCNNCSYFDACRGFCRGQSMVRTGTVTGLLGRSTSCARNDKIRATGVRPIRVSTSTKVSSIA